MKHNIDLCIAAGINVRNMDPLDVFLLAGKIMRDSEVKALASRRGNTSFGGSEEAVRAMTHGERIALRERVTNVIPFKPAVKAQVANGK